MSLKQWETVQKKTAIQTSRVKLQTFTGQEIQTVGEAKGQVEYEGQTAELPLIIVKDEGAPTLFGRDWLDQLKLDWPSIKHEL